jgi:hypothetical protein
VFSDASISKAGVAVNGDAACLRKWGGLTSVDFQGLVQLKDIRPTQQGGLKGLAEELLFEDAAGLTPVHIKKDMTLTNSSCENWCIFGNISTGVPETLQLVTVADLVS